MVIIGYRSSESTFVAEKYHFFYVRCLGQQNPCEGISLGSCDIEPDSIIKTYTATPDR